MSRHILKSFRNTGHVPWRAVGQELTFRMTEHMDELVFERQAAAEYDRAFAHVTRYFMPFVLRAARIAPGMRVLDISAGSRLLEC